MLPPTTHAHESCTTNLHPKHNPRYLLGRLDKLDDPMLMETWKDIVETWLALFELTSTVLGF